MSSAQTAELYDSAEAARYYEERYVDGYMDEWPADKKQRVFDLIRELGLPDHGRALDFGCGNGVFTEVARQALGPGWQIVGTEISKTAVENARRRFPACTFRHWEDPALRDAPYDFFFTHHVLEHVYDLEEVLRSLDGLMAPRAAGLHILPCGNEGSFQHQLALMRSDGIDPQLGNRFFMDEEGHVRRLRTRDLEAHYELLGYELFLQRYCVFEQGFVHLLTDYGPERVLLTLDPSKAVDTVARRRLKALRVKYLLLWFLRHQAPMVREKLGKNKRSLRDYALLALGAVLYPVSRPIDSFLRAADARDWKTQSYDSRAGEMYLAFRRNAS